MCAVDIFSQDSISMDMYVANTPEMENLSLSNSVEIMNLSADHIGNDVIPRDDPPKFSAADIDTRVESFIEEQLKVSDDDCLSKMNADRFGILEYLQEHLNVAVCQGPTPAMECDLPPALPWEVLYNGALQHEEPAEKVPVATDDDGDTKQWLIYDPATARERRPLLFEFIRLLLDNEQYRHVAEYVDRHRGIFKLHQPKEVANLWKQVKGRNCDTNMTYDKLARALRYYYSNGIMHSHPGRFTFRFGAKSGFRSTWVPGDGWA